MKNSVLIKSLVFTFFVLLIIAVSAAYYLGTKTVDAEDDFSPCIPSDIIKKCALTVAVVNSPVTYYLGTDNYEGYEYDLLKKYADHLNVEISIVEVKTVQEALDAVNDGKADIAAASITDSDIIPDNLMKSPSFRKVNHVFICSDKYKKSRKIKDILDKPIMVSKESLYIETIENLSDKYPALKWRVVEEISEEQILSLVENDEADCTLVSSDIANITLRYMPGLKEGFPATKPKEVFWVTRNDKSLKKSLESWFKLVKRNGFIADVEEKYFGHLRKMERFDITMFHKRAEVRLPKYIESFKKAAQKYELDWRLLAAVAYQESLWDNDSVSKTGVRGLMMLTNDTASFLGVKNRLNPSQSIKGGAKYLRMLINKVPDGVVDDDRLKMGLAAYNVGFGHLLDARRVALWLDKDRDKWRDLKKALPLLTRPSIYSKLKHGYARGMEPVIYVDNIFNYYDMLTKIFPEPAINGDDKPIEEYNAKTEQKEQADPEKDQPVITNSEK